VKSIQERCAAPILIAEDSDTYTSKQIQELGQVRFFQMPFDCGLAAKRNWLLDKVQEPFFLMADQDHILLDDPSVLIDILKEQDATIVSASIDGHCNRWVGYYSMSGVDLQLNFLERTEGLTEARFVPNFFMANTGHFFRHKIRWDESLHICEHIDFFLRFPRHLKIFHSDHMLARETEMYDPKYDALRMGRRDKYMAIFRDKYRLKRDPIHVFNVKKPQEFPSLREMTSKRVFL
jgi:hypothetical protein